MKMRANVKASAIMETVESQGFCASGRMTSRGTAVLKTAGDKEVRVLHQLAYTLGDVPGAAAKQTLAKLANALAPVLLRNIAPGPSSTIEAALVTMLALSNWNVPAICAPVR